MKNKKVTDNKLSCHHILQTDFISFGFELDVLVPKLYDRMHYYPSQKINILLLPCQHQVALTYNQTSQLLFIRELTTTEYILPHCSADVCLQRNISIYLFKLLFF